jgi:hypothetical protein
MGGYRSGGRLTNGPGERALAEWLSSERRRVRLGKRAPEQVAALQEIGALEAFPAERAWWKRAEQVETFVADMGRRPGRGSERALLTWIQA